MGLKEDMEQLNRELAEEQERRGQVVLFKDIQFPVEVSAVKAQTLGALFSARDRDKIGRPVRIRPVDDEKTYLGIYLGDMIAGTEVWMFDKSKELCIGSRTNPAIFVPELKKVIWGSGSWWAFIEDEKDLDRMITDADINNIWYVRALKDWFGANGSEAADASPAPQAA